MFTGIGIILLVAGAILAFAVNESVESVDLVMIGWILIAAGGLSLLIGAVRAMGLMSMQTNRVRTERQVSSDGNVMVEETRTD